MEVFFFQCNWDLCLAEVFCICFFSHAAFDLFLDLMFAVDIISAIEFDKSGDHLATGDRGGRVVLFERTDTRDVSQLIAYLFISFMLLFFPP